MELRLLRGYYLPGDARGLRAQSPRHRGRLLLCIQILKCVHLFSFCKISLLLAEDVFVLMDNHVHVSGLFRKVLLAGMVVLDYSDCCRVGGGNVFTFFFIIVWLFFL